MEKSSIRQLTVMQTGTVGETERAGADFAESFLCCYGHAKSTIVALFGDLGVGKTAFVRGAVGRLVPGAAVQSPTYAIVKEYQNENFCVYHFDMYRIEDESSLESIDFWGYLEKGGICFIEWSENIASYLPSNYYRVTLTCEGGEQTDHADTAVGIKRRICIEKITSV